jgi:hypothetical protein
VPASLKQVASMGDLILMKLLNLMVYLKMLYSYTGDWAKHYASILKLIALISQA